ncbi:MAG TPA: hypothetical protein VEC14_11035 [Reyranellaceae bacterium]|nr:hypothetical protein [Reyranellaceae bacterium]
MRTRILWGCLVALACTPALADSRSEKYRDGGCDVERKFDSGKMESKIECKPRYGANAGSGKEEFRRGDCLIKREWKANGEYKEEVKCD